jgi:hypothetical protein
VRYPQIAFAFLIDLLRRIPGMVQLERRTFWIGLLLVLIAVIAFTVWASERTPQRIGMSGLVAGELSHLQTWIIVTGDVREEGITSDGYQYAMTDPAVPDAKLIITSDTPLPLGETTVSGTLVGGTGGAPEGFAWLGQLRADPIVAREPDPPWIAIALVGVAVFLGLGARTSYPVFVAQQVPLIPAARSVVLPVGIVPDGSRSSPDVVPGELVVKPGESAVLRVPGREPQVLRLHSAHSSVAVGELRRLSRSDPALVMRPASGDLTLTFASVDDRNAAYAVIAGNLLRRD